MEIQGEQGSWLEREPMHLDVAQSLLHLGRAAEALERLQKPLEVLRAGLGDQAPEVLQGWRLRGAALLALGRAAEAVAPLEQAVRGAESSGIDPNDQAEGRFLLARALLEAGQPDALAAEQVKRAREDYARTDWPHPARRAELLRWAATRLPARR
jgi:tetratricopeptide (TPR) repeat protein